MFKKLFRKISAGTVQIAEEGTPFPVILELGMNGNFHRIGYPLPQSVQYNNNNLNALFSYIIDALCT